jgi:hypothetical protein
MRDVHDDRWYANMNPAQHPKKPVKRNAGLIPYLYFVGSTFSVRQFLS